MNFSCDQCHRRYSIADDRIRGRTVRVRCRQCSHLITVHGPPAQPEPNPWEDEATRAAPALHLRAEWFVLLAGKQAGPFDPRRLSELVASGELTVRSWVWRKGMPQWARGADVPELALIFAGARIPPPPPPAPAPAPVAPLPSPPPPARPASPPSPKHGPDPATLDALFSDEDLPGPEPEPAPRHKTPAPDRSKRDPFAAVSARARRGGAPVGVATRSYMRKAGVYRRNPFWKIALWVVVGLGLVGGALFVLDRIEVVPLRVTTVGDSGEPVQQSFFSAEGVSALGDRLLGRDTSQPAPATKKTAAKKTRGGKKGTREKAAESTTDAELAALYADDSRADRGPRIRERSTRDVAAPDKGTGGPSAEDVRRVVAQSQRAFQGCIDDALRRNPNLQVPRFFLRATVTNAGVVREATIDRKDIDASPLGECLKSRARRMVFARFSGDEVDVEIPLIVGVAM